MRNYWRGLQAWQCPLVWCSSHEVESRVTSNRCNEICFVCHRLTISETNRKRSSNLADIGKMHRLSGLCCLCCVMHGLRVLVIVDIWKHIVKISNNNWTRSEKSCRMNKEQNLCLLPVSLLSGAAQVESLVFTLFGLRGVPWLLPQYINLFYTYFISDKL